LGSAAVKKVILSTFRVTFAASFTVDPFPPKRQ